MLFPLIFVCPITYLTLRQAAIMRHRLFDVPEPLHTISMRLVYGR